tara:strand:- start:565 stop:747 length:183 start_codon:yes stop_codon:yes gene_type:complete
MDNITYSVCETTGEFKVTFDIPIYISGEKKEDKKEDKNITSKLKNNKKKKGCKKKVIKNL